MTAIDDTARIASTTVMNAISDSHCGDGGEHFDLRLGPVFGRMSRNWVQSDQASLYPSSARRDSARVSLVDCRVSVRSTGFSVVRAPSCLPQHATVSSSSEMGDGISKDTRSCAASVFG